MNFLVRCYTKNYYYNDLLRCELLLLQGEIFQVVFNLVLICFKTFFLDLVFFFSIMFFFSMSSSYSCYTFNIILDWIGLSIFLFILNFLFLIVFNYCKLKVHRFNKKNVLSNCILWWEYLHVNLLLSLLIKKNKP